MNFDYFIDGLEDDREEEGAPLIMIYDRTKRPSLFFLRDLI